MKPIIESALGGTIVMTLAAVLWLFGPKSFFIRVLAWPALIFRPLFPAPAPDQMFPVLGGYAGIITTLITATLAYSALIYLALSLYRALSVSRNIHQSAARQGHATDQGHE